MSDLLWEPPAARKAASNMAAFMARAHAEKGAAAEDYAALHRWSVERPEAFWDLLWDEVGIIGEKGAGPVIEDGDRMPGARFFPRARLNYAENLLRLRGEAPAIVFRREDGLRRICSRDWLHDMSSCLAQALAAAGLGEGDRVAAYLPNMPEAIAVMAAAAALGATFSSCSPDFGAAGVLDRFGQIEPRILFAVDGYKYAGRDHDIRANLAEVANGLPSVETVVVIPYLTDEPDLSAVPKAVSFAAFMGGVAPGPIAWNRGAFDRPLFILYSSGTTGKPKCIVHGAGGALLMNLKEHRLHADVCEGDRVFYFTTLGWMMWNWLLGGLAFGAVLMLYDGSPFHPTPDALWDFAEEEGISHLGLSAKYVDAVRKAEVAPAAGRRLAVLRSVLTTGSPLAPESFNWLYDTVKADMAVASMSGGTDLLGCFVGANPLGAVHRGEIQAPQLGMDVRVFDSEGRNLLDEKGELVCARPFPSMPVMFWNDPGDTRYHEAYFARWDNVWRQGDFASVSSATGGMIIYGRSDATLNPGGVRIGTAEIYREAESIDEVEEALAIGQEWQGDTRIVLFVRLATGAALDDALRDRIRRRIRERASPRHMPAVIAEVADIPRTRSGKIVELAVREVVHGRPVANIEALENPEALEHFRGRAELQT
ncbi:MAG: acetoacetate--CoA ligase [Alphaproteobacteria bacterium]|nr:acetoacetate--CoA ligase [Alphaproteobacteria bacterium]